MARLMAANMKALNSCVPFWGGMGLLRVRPRGIGRVGSATWVRPSAGGRLRRRFLRSRKIPPEQRFELREHFTALFEETLKEENDNGDPCTLSVRNKRILG